MRSIFTYPDNPSTYYIDPRYIGNDNAGFQKRIKDLMEENIYNLDTLPPQSVTDTMTFLGRYYNFYDGFGETNITLFDFKQFEMAEIVSRSLAVPVTQIASNSDGSATLTTSRAHNITTGSTNVRYNIDVTAPTGQNDLSSTSASASLFTYPTTTTIKVPKSFVNPGGSTFRLHRDGDGVRLRTDASLAGLTDGMRISHEGSFYKDDGGTIPTPSGTVTTANGNYYIKTISGTNFSYKLYTDHALTTEATLTEEDGGGFYTLVYGTGQKQTLLDYGNPNWAQGLKDFANAQPGNNGWCRIYFTVQTPGATFTPSVDSGKDIPSSTDYSTTFFWEWNSTNETFSFYAERSTSNQLPMDWILTDGAEARLTIDLIDPLRLTNDDIHFRYLSGDTLSSDSYFMLDSDWDDANNRAFHELDPDETKVYWYGTRNRRYLDINGNFVAGADIRENVSLPGTSDRPNRTTDSRWVTQPTHTLGFDSNNKLNSWTISGGRFSTADVFRYAQGLVNKDDEYVNPGPTNLELAQAEDDFDVFDNWNNFTEYTSNQKRWPAINPRSVKVNMKTPTIMTYSQSGQKFVRNAGFARYTLDINYPPLTSDQMMELIGYSQLARGGAVTFILDLKPLGGTDAEMIGLIRNVKSNSTPRVLEWDSTNLIMKVEGFESNESEVFRVGQFLNANSGNRNGGIEIAANDCDANVFGEAKVRFNFKDMVYSINVGSTITTVNDDIVVSLQEDNFQYTQRGDGLYDCSVSFDLDFWK